MNTNLCETYRNQILDLLDGTLDVSRREQIELHLAACADCRAGYDAYQRLIEDLNATGDIVRTEVPEVELLSSVLIELERLKSGMRTLSELERNPAADHEAADIYAAVEDSMDEVGAARWNRRLEANPGLSDEVEVLRLFHSELQDAADSLTAAEPEVDILKSVMERVASLGGSDEVERCRQELNETDVRLLESTLDNGPQPGFEHACALNPALDNEYRSLTQVKGALEAMGAEILAQTPPVDIVDKVMKAVGGRQTRPHNLISMPARPKPSVTARTSGLYSWWGRGVAAAAATTLIGFAFLLFALVSRPGQEPHFAKKTAESGKPTKPGVSDEKHLFKAVEPVAPLLMNDDAGAAPPEIPQEQKNGISFEDALAVRQAAMQKDANALMRLGQWASLAPEEARTLLENSGLSPEAVVGAAQFLPPEEAAAVLRAAVANNPENPYLRFALAKNLSGIPTAEDEAREQLAAWSELDPDNGMPHFMDANLLLANGKADDALNCLQDASARNSANTYALIAARCQREALIASGMDPEVAKLVAASTAGVSEAENITDIGNQLLAYGRQYENMGDYETAAMIYEAMQNLGMQVDSGAVMANERNAGLTTALQAIDALQQIYQILQEPDSLQVLSSISNSLITGLNQVNTLVNEYNTIFNSNDQDAINHLLDLMLTYGDLSYQD